MSTLLKYLLGDTILKFHVVIYTVVNVFIYVTHYLKNIVLKHKHSTRSV